MAGQTAAARWGRRPLALSLTGARSELGRVLAALPTPAAGPHAAVHINLAGQQANTLLHDGHAWQDFPRLLLASTRRALRSAKAAGAASFVHASFAFVRAVEHGARLDDPLAFCVAAILQAEALVLSGTLPGSVVRLGYLYGPHSADLRAYKTAFGLMRPYWSGDEQAQQHHLHQHDAARALLAAARAQASGKTWYATDGQAASFEALMDGFAHRVGCKRPLHLPRLSAPLARVIICTEHMQQTALAMPKAAPSPLVPRWRPCFGDHDAGLDQVIQTWQQAG